MAEHAPKLYANPFVTALHFTRFKALADIDIPLASRFVVLVGANSVGKSSVLQGVTMIERALNRDVNHHPLHDRRAKFTDEQHPQAIRTRGETGPVMLGATIAGDRRLDLAIDDDWVHDEHSESKTELKVSDPSSDATYDYARLADCAWFRFDARAAMRASELSTGPSMHEDGRGLPSALSWLAANEPDLRTAIERDLATVVPGARRVFMPTKIEQRTRTVMVPNDKGRYTNERVREPTTVVGLEVEFEGRGKLDAALVSEGTLLTLALLTTLHRPNPPTLLLLDDLDKGLHPQAQEKLVEVIGRLLDERPELQIIATTHSPYLVNHVHPEAVVLMAADDAGHAHARRLTEHPRFERWEKSLAAGEMWPYFGEAWVLGESDATKALETR